MATFVITPFKANNVEDALQQVLNSSAIPKNVQKISKDIINNFPRKAFKEGGIYWEASSGDILECYKSSGGYEFGLLSKQLPRDLVFSCYGRVDQSNAVPPYPSKESNVMKKIFDYEQKIKGKYTERAAIFDKDGNMICYSSGDNKASAVPFIGDGIYLTHSHPDLVPYDEDVRFRKIHFGTTFSIDDFNLFLQYRNLKQLRVVFSNGVVMVCEKTKPILTKSDVDLALKVFSRNDENRSNQKAYDDFVQVKGVNLNDDEVDLNRKILKYSYEKDKRAVGNIGLHIYFLLKDGRTVENLKGKKTKPKKSKKIGDNFHDLIF